MTQLPPGVEPQDASQPRRTRTVAAVRTWIGALVVASALIPLTGPESPLRSAMSDVGTASAAQAAIVPDTAVGADSTARSTDERAPLSGQAATAPSRPIVLGTSVVSDDESVMLSPTSRQTEAQDSVFVIGDSVMLGAEWALPDALAEWDIVFDAEGSRRLPQGLDILEARNAEVGRVLVVMFGNNLIPGERGTFGEQIDELMAMFPDIELVVWLTVAETSDTRVAVNKAIRAGAQRHPNLAVADWAPVIDANPDYAAEDRLHLGPAGARALAELVRIEVDEAGLRPASR